MSQDTHTDHIEGTPTIGEVQTFMFKDIPVPFRVHDRVTVVSNNGEVSIKDSRPHHITHLETYLRTGSHSSLTSALTCMCREGIMDLARQLSLKAEGYTAPVAISAGVPPDHVYLDTHNGRIVLSEMQALSRFVDADGDVGVVIPNKEMTKAVFIKWPITMKPLILTIMKEPPMETYYNFTKEDALGIIQSTVVPQPELGSDEEYTAFEKTHTVPPIGLITSGWNCNDLYRCVSERMSFQEKLDYIFNSHLNPNGIPQRAIDLETLTMKGIRKDGATVQATSILNMGSKYVLLDQYSQLLTSISQIPKKVGKRLSWFDSTDIQELTSQVLNLEVKFRELQGKGKRDIEEEEEEVKPKGFLYNLGLVTRLHKLGLLDWVEIPHEGLPVPSVMLYLKAPNGNMVALTDVKRNGQPEGLTYAFILPPVWDNRDLYEPNNPEKISEYGRATHEWTHPIVHLNKVLATLDMSIRPYQDGPITGYFPQNISDWQNPSRAIKIANLQAFILDYCNSFGDSAPAHRKNNEIVLSPYAKSIASKSVVIDYGKPCVPEEMITIAQKARETCKFSIIGRKSDSTSIGKYLLANEVGGTILDPECKTGSRRGGQARSQLLRALRKEKFVVAIVKSDTISGVQITPSGIEKQAVKDTFLPRVFKTEEDLESFLSNRNLTYEEAGVAQHDYYTWQGELRRCWTTSAKSGIHTGKLVDVLGNKFMPRPVEQLYAVRHEKRNPEIVQVDLIIPYNELVDKATHVPFFETAKEYDLYHSDSEHPPVVCLITERSFFRSGAFSENTPPRWRKFRIKGIDSFPIQNALTKAEIPFERNPDLTYALSLQEAIKRIHKMLRWTSEDGS